MVVALPPLEKTEGPMLNLELVRGPLPNEDDYPTIFAEYSRLTPQSSQAARSIASQYETCS